MRNPRTRRRLLDVLQRDLQKEMTNMVSKKSNSCLRQRTIEALQSFSWEKLCSELKSHAPTLYRILQACVDVKRWERVSKDRRTKPRSYYVNNSVVLGICAAIILRHCNTSMNLVQRIISIVLHCGHAAKQVMESHSCTSYVPYSGYFSGGKIFMRSEFLPNLWKHFHGRGILSHTLVHCGTISWVKSSRFASQPRKPRNFYPPKNTRYTVCEFMDTFTCRCTASFRNSTLFCHVCIYIYL